LGTQARQTEVVDNRLFHQSLSPAQIDASAISSTSATVRCGHASSFSRTSSHFYETCDAECGLISNLQTLAKGTAIVAQKMITSMVALGTSSSQAVQSLDPVASRTLEPVAAIVKKSLIEVADPVIDGLQLGRRTCDLNDKLRALTQSTTTDMQNMMSGMVALGGSSS